MKNLRKYAPLALVFGAFLFASCPNGGQGSGSQDGILLSLNVAVPTGREVAIPKDLAGVIHTGYSNDLDAEYELLEEMSVRWVHRDFSWNRVQPDVPYGHERFEDWDWLKNENWNFGWLDDYVRRANYEGKLVMGMLLYDTPWIHRKHTRPDHPPGHPQYQPGNPGRRREVREEQIDYFVNYAVETVRRYSRGSAYGTVHSWFIWNEPCLQPRFWTWTQEDFLELTLRTARAIRPLTDAYIVGGVFSVHALSDREWVDGLFRNGAYRYLHGLAFHPYGPSPNGNMAFFNRFVDMVRMNDEAHGTDFADNIWVNEVGFPSFGIGTGGGWEGIPPQHEEDMPEAVTQTFALLAAAGVRNIMWYNMFDYRAGRDGFGLVWTGGDSRPSEYWERKGGYWGFALSARHIPGTTYREMNFFPGGTAPDSFQTHYFANGNGGRVLLFWNDSPEHTREVTVALGQNTSNRRLWDVTDGTYVSFNATSTHTLHPRYTFQQTMVFMTWDEDEE